VRDIELFYSINFGKYKPLFWLFFIFAYGPFFQTQVINAGKVFQNDTYYGSRLRFEDNGEVLFAILLIFNALRSTITHMRQTTNIIDISSEEPRQHVCLALEESRQAVTHSKGFFFAKILRNIISI
jgi:hypothetical protein